eukprot:gnl/TRDRNA2_/TRDRNA2_193315_c0_seq1.p1 gnl/TRDRNA2_/TRDRNA2_193315_c0~~gnl/TRDRNA2_/TRDRNA2_193315_c0_seq1.p1  ORF type:complete len:307 (-),score=86.10 gnl/TRDRNA2_/TRDRNA2_193315_c0_seq1:63-983(-)
MAAATAPSAAQTYAQGPLTASGKGPLSEQQLADAKKELKRLKEEMKLREPVRAFFDDQVYLWRFGKPPDYTLANLAYLKGKSMNHPEGSLEQIVEDIVKTWEFERSHKLKHSQHKSVDPSFRIGANGNKMFAAEEAHEVGNYNVLLDGVKPELWSPSMTWEQSHEEFKQAFAAFPWEVLKVFSGPPKVSFSWRHWAHFTGKYKGNKGKGELINMYGWATATVSADLKLKDVEVFYNPEEFLEVMEGKKSPDVLNTGKSVLGPQIEFLKKLDNGTQDVRVLPEEGESACPVTKQRGKCQFMGCGISL